MMDICFTIPTKTSNLLFSSSDIVNGSKKKRKPTKERIAAPFAGQSLRWTISACRDLDCEVRKVDLALGDFPSARVVDQLAVEPLHESEDAVHVFDEQCASRGWEVHPGAQVDHSDTVDQLIAGCVNVPVDDYVHLIRLSQRGDRLMEVLGVFPDQILDQPLAPSGELAVFHTEQTANGVDATLKELRHVNSIAAELLHEWRERQFAIELIAVQDQTSEPGAGHMDVQRNQGDIFAEAKNLTIVKRLSSEFPQALVVVSWDV
jgi:hypothetical protein